MKLLIISLTAIILFASFTDVQHGYLVPVGFPEKFRAVIAGLVLINIAFYWILIAEIQMSRSLRSGIDEKKQEKAGHKSHLSM
ncbi:hypothetical protein [Pollutibacter soli]|uniref:hypothetical protein n=1 Tax=Pollutibacter soli TaxID=3034157 RepID=UPI0030134755